MQSLPVVNLLYELAYVLLGFLEVLLILQINFLHLQRPRKKLSALAFS